MVKRVNLLAFMWFFSYLCNVEKGKRFSFHSLLRMPFVGSGYKVIRETFKILNYGKEY